MLSNTIAELHQVTRQSRQTNTELFNHSQSSYQTFEMASITGLRVIIAGAATGVGARTAKLLASRGAKVVVADVNIDAAMEVNAEINSCGGSATVIEFDLADEASIKNLIEKGSEWLGGLDSLLNIGADLSPTNLGNDRAVGEMDAEVWHRTFLVNTTGYALTTKYALPHLKSGGGGTIINISSMGGHYMGIPEPQRVAYAASKAAVHALTRHTATTYGGDNIRSNTVALGPIATPTLLKNIEASPKMQEALKKVPLQRLGKPEEVAALLAFMISSDAAYITGDIWSINGGTHVMTY